MKELRLVAIDLKNFKGITALSVEPDGKDLEILGMNGLGKTTIADAFIYLFTGQDSLGNATPKIKPLDSKGNDIHFLETEVEALVTFNGENKVFKKIFKEKWPKKRGSKTTTFTGHTTDHFLDGVPATEGEYKKAIAKIFDPEIFKLTTNPQAFNNLHWKKMRDILMEMCGGVKDIDVLETLYPSVKDKDKYNALANILNKRSLEDHKKKIAAQKLEINKELDKIPVRIDETTLSLKDVKPIDEVKLKGIEKHIEEIDTKISELKSKELISKKKVELSEVKNKILKLKSKSYDTGDDKTGQLKEKLKLAKAENQKLFNEIMDIEETISLDVKRNESVERALEKLRVGWFKIDDKKASVKEECPACGQDLPEEEVEAAIEKFNTSKAEKLKANTTEGKELKKGFDEREKAIKENTEKAKELCVIADKAKEGFAAVEKEIQGLINDPVKIETPDLDKKQVELERLIEELENNQDEVKAAMEKEKENLKAELKPFKDQKAINNAAEKAKLRIIELEAKEKELSAIYEALEQETFMIEDFIVKKVESLEDKINSMFKLAKFKMFNVQVNGGIEECCTTMYDGVPFNNGLNTAAIVNVGIDITNSLSDYYGFRSVMFVDKRESVNKLVDTKSQIISLTVSKDKELTFK